MVMDAYFQPYQQNRLHDLASVTKSVCSVLIGIAIDKGFLASANVPVTDVFGNRSIENLGPAKRKLTIRHLLSMTSGFERSFPDDEDQLLDMRKTGDWIQYVLDLPVSGEPGDAFDYFSCNYHPLSRKGASISRNPPSAQSRIDRVSSRP